MTQPDKLIGNHIVSMLQYNGRIMVATRDFIFDITDNENPIVMFSCEAASNTVMGKKYELREISE